MSGFLENVQLWKQLLNNTIQFSYFWENLNNDIKEKNENINILVRQKSVKNNDIDLNNNYNVTVICKLILKRSKGIYKDELILIKENLNKFCLPKEIESEIDKIELKFKNLIIQKSNLANNLLIQDYKGNIFNVIDIWDKIEKYQMLVIYNENTLKLNNDFLVEVNQVEVNYIKLSN